MIQCLGRCGRSEFVICIGLGHRGEFSEMERTCAMIQIANPSCFVRSISGLESLLRPGSTKMPAKFDVVEEVILQTLGNRICDSSLKFASNSTTETTFRKLHISPYQCTEAVNLFRLNQYYDSFRES